MRIYYGARTGRGYYTHMIKGRTVTKKGGYVAPLLEKPPMPSVEEPKKVANMNKVIERLEKLQVGRPKKNIVFTF